ncbi:MAG TPA: methyltransferase domain-containing protein [Anaerolineales bacterium]|nr:methyltransferase domain-containing protein [Anaerolineales bacterium]
MDETYAWDRQNTPAVSYRFRTRALTVVRAIQRHAQETGSLHLLDLGAADGGTLLEMGRLLGPGTRLTGVEYSPVLVGLAQGLGSAVQVVRGDIASLPAAIKEQRYDVVTVMAVLEHLEQPLRAIQEAAAVLKPGGLLVATTPQPFWDLLATRLRLLEDHHETHIGGAQMVADVRQAGLEVLEYSRFMWAPVGFLPYLGIRIQAKLAQAIDQAVQKVHVFNWLFVNQMVVARKPASAES